MFGHQNGFEKVPSDSGIFWSTGELREFTGGSIGPYWALVKRREGPQGEAARPHGLVRIGLGGGGAPLFPSPSPPPSLSPPLGKGRGLQLGLGILVGLPLARAPLWSASSPPPLYTDARAPQRHTKSSLSRVRCPLHSYTPRSYCHSA